MQTIRFENFNFFPDQKILDIGCGQGRHCFGAYMHAHLHVYGIDMGLDDVKKANENFNQFKESENEKRRTCFKAQCGINKSNQNAYHSKITS